MKIIKNLLFALLGSLLIALCSSLYYEVTFYNNHAPVMDIKNGAIKFVYKNQLCPTNWELAFWKNSLFRIKNKQTLNPHYNPYNKTDDIMMLDPSRFVYVNNEKEKNALKRQIIKEIKTCKIVINSDPITRVAATTAGAATQPLHLILGWILVQLIIKFGNLVKPILPKKISDFILKTGYVLRGLYRTIVKAVKNLFRYLYKIIEYFKKEGK